MYVLSAGVRPKMRPVAAAKKAKRTKTVMRQIGYLRRPPTSSVRESDTYKLQHLQFGAANCTIST